jgi:hypothetical protein
MYFGFCSFALFLAVLGFEMRGVGVGLALVRQVLSPLSHAPSPFVLFLDYFFERV